MKMWRAAHVYLLLACALAAPALGGTVQIIGAMGGDGGGGAQDYADESAVPVDLAIREEAFSRALKPGSIVVNTHTRKLYFVLSGGRARVYPVGVGRQGFSWSGKNRVSRKAEWPDWRPPANMIAREERRGRFLPTVMAGGPGNPLGARALYIGDTEYRIHGTTDPGSIGRAVSSGCIRLLNRHVIDLYERVAIGATVVVE